LKAPPGRLRVAAALTVALACATVAASAQPSAAQTLPAGAADHEARGFDVGQDVMVELRAAAVRLPLAAALGAVLAWRPRRRGSPPRRAAVIETQIVLAVVGAVIMLVVGASLARAFGIVGVASLIRYRSKINDPRDAVVMLSALGVGLAAGTGLFALAVFSTLFLAVLLFVVEGFERSVRKFELALQLGPDAARLRPEIEQVLRRHEVAYELRATSEEESTYLVTVPNEVSTSRVSKALAALAANGKLAVEWRERTKG
jgi:uncharacterized membrane protein YhiD involved in acid resistance